MSNVVGRPLGGLVVPERFRGRGVQETLGAGISSGFPIIRLRGSKWWLSTGKDEEHRIPTDTIDVVILRAPPFTSRAYYKGYKGAASKGERPACSSLQAVRPDAGVEDPQSETCDMCKRNQTYTNDKGMKVRDCSNGKRLAVLPWIDWTTELLGTPLLRPCLLRVPGASLKALADYGEELGRAGMPYYGLLTRLSFEQSKEYPKIIFNYNTAVRLDNESTAIIDVMRETPEARFITGESSPGGMQEYEHREEEAPAEVIHKPKPAAVSLAQAIKASNTDEGDTQVPLDGEIIAPPKANGKKVPKAVAVETVVEAHVDTGDGDNADDALKQEVLQLLGR